MLVQASKPDVLSLALGLPAPEFFPNTALARVARCLLEEQPSALQYGPPPEALRRQIVELMAWRGVRCVPEQIMITTGAQQALSLLTRLLLDPGGSILVEQLTYTGLLQAALPLHAQIHTVPTDANAGIDVDAVEEAFRSTPRPAFLYASSESHNPLGVTIVKEHRERLVKLARHHRIPIIEDDAYGFLSYDQPPIPPMRYWDDEFVLYVGSFSKIQAPALRVGWIVAPANIIPQLSILKEATDINSGTIAQRILARYLEEGCLREHIAALRTAYRERRDALLKALTRHFEGVARWNKPSSGVFLWLELNEDIDTTELLPHALAGHKVAFIPGASFSADGRSRAERCLRLNFSHLPPPLIEEGVARLARSVAAFRGLRRG